MREGEQSLPPLIIFKNMEEIIMAVKKANKATEEVKVETPVVEEPVVETTEVEVETPVVETEVEETVEEAVETDVETPVVEVPDVEVEDEPKAEEPKVEVDQAEVNTGNKPNGNVKIRMRVDHKCCIAMERYDLKAGKTYVVPENVKRILNKAGLLAPL